MLYYIMHESGIGVYIQPSLRQTSITVITVQMSTEFEKWSQDRVKTEQHGTK